MISVTVVLYATLGRYHPEGSGTAPFSVKLKPGVVVDDLLTYLGISQGEAKQVFSGHLSRPGSYRLQDGERVAIFPPIAGG
ncbi:MAG: MoaD/ThiS family protein [Bacillota bacterium]